MRRTLEGLASVVYWLTGDIERGDRAIGLAANHDLRMQVLFPKDLPPPPDALAVIVDRDNLNLWLDPRGLRDLLGELLTRSSGVLTIVLGNDMKDREGPDLDYVVLERRLDDLLRWLAAHAQVTRTENDFTSPSPIPEEDEGFILAEPAEAEPLCMDEDDVARTRLGTKSE
jgi:hypothetical protein